MNEYTLEIYRFGFLINDMEFDEKFETVWTYVTENEFDQFIEQYEMGLKKVTAYMEADGWTVERTGINLLRIAKDGASLGDADVYVHDNLWLEPDIFPVERCIRDEFLLTRDIVELMELDPTEFCECQKGPNTIVNNEYENELDEPVYFNPEYTVY